MPPGYTVPTPNELERLHSWVESEIIRLGYVDQRMLAREKIGKGDTTAKVKKGSGNGGEGEFGEKRTWETLG